MTSPIAVYGCIFERVSGLSLQRVIESGIALVADEGLEALALRGVASRIGVTPMALYRYVDDAAALRELVVDQLVARLPAVETAGDPYERYRAWAHETRSVLARYPGLGRHLVLHWFETPTMLETVESLLVVAEELGFSGFAQVAAANAVLSFVLMRVELEETLRVGNALRRELDAMRGRSRALPQLTAQIGEYRRARIDEHFTFGVELLLGGLAQRASEARQARSGGGARAHP